MCVCVCWCVFFLYIYIFLDVTKLSIYTIPETTEPASKIYWINQQVQLKPIYINICIYIYIHNYIYINIKIFIYVYIVLYKTILHIYTNAETTEPASKVYWINQQVEPKPIYMYIYLYICM